MPKKSGSDWIKKAHLQKGAFTKKAEGAGLSVPAYANMVLKKGSKATTTTKRQAALAKTFRKMAKRKQK